MVISLILAAAAAAQSPLDFRLGLPIACTPGESCQVQNYVDRDPGPDAKDYRCGRETYQDHNGVDFRLPSMAVQSAGVSVLAAADGRVTRLRDGMADVSVKAPDAASVQGVECGNAVVIDHGDGWETQYCHLAKGSLSVKGGQVVKRGDPIARVGLSGSTEYPHLHFIVRRSGTALDPFAPGLAAGACDSAAQGRGLWSPSAAAQLAYRQGSVLNAGFVDAPPTAAMVEEGRLSQPTAESGTLVAYVRSINLQAGDVQRLTILAPDGSLVAKNEIPALDKAKAQYLVFAGRRKPATGWAAGRYSATFEVVRGGQSAVRKAFALTLP